MIVDFQQHYTPPEMLEKFTAETGITVTLTDFDSNDTALTRIRQGLYSSGGGEHTRCCGRPKCSIVALRSLSVNML